MQVHAGLDNQDDAGHTRSAEVMNHLRARSSNPELGLGNHWWVYDNAGDGTARLTAAALAWESTRFRVAPDLRYNCS